MLRRFKQRAAEEFGFLASRARPALITTESQQDQPIVSDYLKLNEEPHVDVIFGSDDLLQVEYEDELPARLAEEPRGDSKPSRSLTVHVWIDNKSLSPSAGALQAKLPDPNAKRQVKQRSSTKEPADLLEPHANLLADRLNNDLPRLLTVRLRVNNESFPSPTGDLQAELPVTWYELLPPRKASPTFVPKYRKPYWDGKRKRYNYFARCPCRSKCGKFVGWDDRYKMTLPCAEYVWGHSWTKKYKQGKWVRFRTYRYGDTFDPETGKCTSDEITEKGQALPHEMCFHPLDESRPDFEDWKRKYSGTRDKRLKQWNERYLTVEKPLLEADADYREEKRRRKREYDRQSYQKQKSSGRMKLSSLPSGPDGGRTKEFDVPGIVNEMNDEQLLKWKHEFDSAREKHPNALFYIYKATAEDFSCRDQFLENGNRNVANLEQYRWSIQQNCNNFFLTGNGSTTPLDWFLDGTFVTEELFHIQTNGSEIAFQIEGELIDHGRNNYGMGIGGVANKGRFRGRGDITGVHVVGCIGILNFKELLEREVVAYSDKMTEAQKARVIKNHKKHGTLSLAKFVKPCPEKLASIERKWVYNRERNAARALRNAQDIKEGEEKIGEDLDFFNEEVEYEYASTGMDFAHGTAGLRLAALKKKM